MNKDIGKVFFIINKYSGSGFRPAMENLVSRICSDHGAVSVIEYTQAPGHATQLATDALAAGYDKIIAVGGDGTVNEVARALTHTPASMGIIPKGSGNGLARHLGIPVNLSQAVNCLFTNQCLAIDTFRVNGQLSLNVSGVGFDGYIAALFGVEKQRGFRGYLKLVLNEFRHFEEFEAEIKTGEETLSRKAFVIAIANSSQYGNNARIAPGASVCDQLLNISVLKKFPPYRLDLIYSLFAGTIDKSAYCETIQVRDIVINLRKPAAFHIDGEPAGKAETFTIELLPASLNMLAPCSTI
ncbi:MAG: YegS/Rv2252/BmrU family lipid kinase [Bacteroidota bacterium]|nr:YegS/Rv2252/BmrU family lipid kinase [Bacteroidota bacterium]